MGIITRLTVVHCHHSIVGIFSINSPPSLPPPAGQKDNITDYICRLSPWQAVFLLDVRRSAVSYLLLTHGEWWVFVYMSLAWCLPGAWCPACSG